LQEVLGGGLLFLTHTVLVPTCGMFRLNKNNEVHAEMRKHHIPAQYVPSDTRRRAPVLVSPPTSQLDGVDVSVAGLWPSYTEWSCGQSDG